MLYHSLILKYPIEPLFDVLRRPDFPTFALEDFLTDLFSGNEKTIEQLRPWIEAGQPQYKKSLLSSLELAFDELIHQPKTWLNDQRLFFEKTFQQALLLDDRDKLYRLKSFFSETRAGISAGFLRHLIQESPVLLSIFDEIDLWILFAKFQEELDALNPLSFEEEIFDKLEDRPWLLAVLIYVFREKQPIVALRLLNRWDDKNYQPSKNLSQYVSVYLRHAVYQFLHDAEDAHYQIFLDLMKHLHSSVLKNLLRLVLQHDGMQKIAAKFETVENKRLAKEVIEKRRVRNDLDALLN